MSTDILQFLLEELALSNPKSEIHNMKSLQEWTFAQLYNTCTKKSMHIPKESALEEFNVIIQNNLHRDQMINNIPCKYCNYIIKNMNQSIERRVRQCLHVKHSYDEKNMLIQIKFECKKKIGQNSIT